MRCANTTGTNAIMSLQNARLRLYEDRYILHSPPPKLNLGELGEPDDLGWRWFQCTDTLQIYLPPDISIRYSIFLKMERKTNKLPSSHTTVQRFNRAREEFVNQCLRSKPQYPVRGISPSICRYALEPGFRCSNIDHIVAHEEFLAESRYLSTFDTHLVPRSQLGLLGPTNEWGRSWVRLAEDTQVLLTPDTTSQYHAFLRWSILSDDPHNDTDWKATVIDLTGACLDHAYYLGTYNGDKLYVLERDTSAAVLAPLTNASRTHYHEVAEKARIYAQFAPTRLSLGHSKLRRSNSPILARHPKRRLRGKFGPVLEPLVELQEEEDSTSCSPEPDAGQQCKSKTSSQFSTSTSTTLSGTSTSTTGDSVKMRKGPSVSSLRRTAKFLSSRIPAKVYGRLLTLVARTL
ncbi:hypothetical protein F5878DRAFT_435592 [Lentinula raphanica]|uniref:Uncharacterized protein n=1 Tax=Lentinula raphanica TaxID=153919 RepID=A0AA38PLQ1_9AGAR|nr:hypothetical protein F5878DRAFT_435592 [Lentinula raphanica]